MKTYQDDFEKGISTLEDIQLLSAFSISPLIGRAYFHLSEMKRKADELTIGQSARFDAVSKVLDEKFSSILSDFFADQSKYQGFEFNKSTSKIDLKKWNLILEILPEVLSVVSVFNYRGSVEASLDENKMSFEGMIIEDGHLEINRKFIYIVTRKLLRQKVLLTFDLEKVAKIGMYRLNLKVDISHDETLVYKVNFKLNQSESYLVGFSNIFCHYRILADEFIKIGGHNIIEINNDLTVKSYVGLPELSRLDSANKEILHFPFLFRPISIILPMKGNLSSDALLRSLNDGPNREQDVSKYYRTIDFFSLFNL